MILNLLTNFFSVVRNFLWVDSLLHNEAVLENAIHIEGILVEHLRTLLQFSAVRYLLVVF